MLRYVTDGDYYMYRHRAVRVCACVDSWASHGSHFHCFISTPRLGYLFVINLISGAGCPACTLLPQKTVASLFMCLRRKISIRVKRVGVRVLYSFALLVRC